MQFNVFPLVRLLVITFGLSLVCWRQFLTNTAWQVGSAAIAMANPSFYHIRELCKKYDFMQPDGRDLRTTASPEGRLDHCLPHASFYFVSFVMSTRIKSEKKSHVMVLVEQMPV